MAADDIAARIELRLREQADPARAAQERTYLKSPLEHIGVSVPATRRIVRDVPGIDQRADLTAVARELWRPPIFERRLAAVELLGLHRDLLTADDLEFVETLLRQARTWALVDHLAEWAAGDIAERYPLTAGVVLDAWSVDPDFWLRRSSLLALMAPLRRGGGDLERFSRYADSMLGEREFFVRKAIGWVLRETGKARPDWVRDWLAARPGQVPVLAVREAVKSLPPEQRQPLVISAARVRAPGATSARADRTPLPPR